MQHNFLCCSRKVKEKRQTSHRCRPTFSHESDRHLVYFDYQVIVFRHSSRRWRIVSWSIHSRWIIGWFKRFRPPRKSSRSSVSFVYNLFNLIFRDFLHALGFVRRLLAKDKKKRRGRRDWAVPAGRFLFLLSFRDSRTRRDLELKQRRVRKQEINNAWKYFFFHGTPSKKKKQKKKRIKYLFSFLFQRGVKNVQLTLKLGIFHRMVGCHGNELHRQSTLAGDLHLSIIYINHMWQY